MLSNSCDPKCWHLFSFNHFRKTAHSRIHRWLCLRVQSTFSDHLQQCSNCTFAPITSVSTMYNTRSRMWLIAVHASMMTKKAPICCLLKTFYLLWMGPFARSNPDKTRWLPCDVPLLQHRSPKAGCYHEKQSRWLAAPDWQCLCYRSCSEVSSTLFSSGRRKSIKWKERSPFPKIFYSGRENIAKSTSFGSVL